MAAAAWLGVAELGFAASIAAVWLDTTTFGGAAWDDGTAAAYLLTAGLAGALFVIAAAARPSAGWVRRAFGAALLLLGSYLFFPVSFTPDHLDYLGPGWWLGVCGGLLSLAGLFGFDRAKARTLTRRPPSRGVPSFTPVIGGPLGLAGAGLMVAAIWLAALHSVSFWDYPSATRHPVGIFMLAGGCLAALAIVVGARHPQANAFAAAFACLLLGFVVVIPVSAVDDTPNPLGLGAWLAVTGGLMLVAGTALVWRAPLRLPAGAG